MQFMLAAGFLSAILGLTAFSIVLDLQKNEEVLGIRAPADAETNPEAAGTASSTVSGPKVVPQGFHGPTGQPYVIGPSGPPPNY